MTEKKQPGMMHQMASYNDHIIYEKLNILIFTEHIFLYIISEVNKSYCTFKKGIVTGFTRKGNFSQQF